MRRLVDISSENPTPIVLVPMREKYDCMTCVTAMLLGIKYEDVEQAFGGNIDPSTGKEEESRRLAWAFETLIQKHNRCALHLIDMPPLKKGRRYWITVHIEDPTNKLSEIMGHSIVIDEAGRVFDPNPQYGEFDSLAEWQVAMSLPHQLESATEIFEPSL
jgi:hypothetical protein